MIESPIQTLDDPLFSPLHMPFQAEVGSSCMLHPENYDFNRSLTGMQCHYGANEPDADTSEFLDSIFNQPDECFFEASGIQNMSAIQSENMKNMAFHKDTGSCTGSDAQVAQNLVGGNYQTASFL